MHWSDCSRHRRHAADHLPSPRSLAMPVDGLKEAEDLVGAHLLVYDCCVGPQTEGFC